MKTPDIHFHHDSLEGIYGIELEEGDMLELGDYYDAPGGEWEIAPAYGIRIGRGISAKFIRASVPE
jgi:hypothetical protein